MKKSKSFTTTKNLAKTAIIAGLYFVLTYCLQPISYGAIQFRVAEAMTLLPLICPQAVVGLTLGCLLSNVFSTFGWADMVFGTLATFIAATLTFLIGKKFKGVTFKSIVLGGLPPILVNAAILPLVWLFFSNDVMYFLNFSTVFVSQAVIVYLLGTLLLSGLKKTKLFDK